MGKRKTSHKARGYGIAGNGGAAGLSGEFIEEHTRTVIAADKRLRENIIGAYRSSGRRNRQNSRNDIQKEAE